ncbi:hypothetical protein [Delftia lacustris]|uniref:hypothetical protein n=1 Tax=Delftia lacustris TaxID=558537 RepID=UPI001FCB0050|nr:hypothetical protein [Delftia lacustris]BDE70885.1 hypothetical protein HQS1_20090 [Delftia lacustris]
MHKPRTVKRPGPLPHQRRLHSALQRHRNTALQRWESEIAYYEALQTAGSAPVTPAVLGTYEAQEKHIGAAEGEVTWSFSGFPDAPSSLSRRAISITDLEDRIVIKVGFAELRLTREEAARLFSIGRDTGGEQQG